jgi:hypothetical protein
LLGKLDDAAAREELERAVTSLGADRAQAAVKVYDAIGDILDRAAELEFYRQIRALLEQYVQ